MKINIRWFGFDADGEIEDRSKETATSVAIGTTDMAIAMRVQQVIGWTGYRLRPSRSGASYVIHKSSFQGNDVVEVD